MSDAPVLIFAFNRPNKLRGLLLSLKACPEFATSPLFIFIDGPRNTAERPIVQEVIDIARSNTPPDTTISVRAENIGLKKSIISGVTFVMSAHDRAIILEDDLLVSPKLLTYFNRALDSYQSEGRIWSISGYMYEVPALAERENAMFLPFPNPWGWATWRKAWQRFISMEKDAVPPASSEAFRLAFDAHGIRDFTAILELDRRRLISSWYINFYYAMFRAGGVSLWPQRSLISNQGVTSGTHASILNIGRFLPRSKISDTFLPKLPEDVLIDYEALDAIARSRDVRAQKLISSLGGLRRRVRAAIGESK